MIRTFIKNLNFSSRILTSTCNCSAPKTMASSSSSTNNATLFAACYVTVPDENIAKKLAHGIVEKKLAACVNIIPSITSVYSWEGKINEDSEMLLMIKTRKSRVDELSEYVRNNHPYTTAEVISVAIENGNPPYLDWIANTVPEK
uniref:CSON015526 protein n=1 Tax=Culicoides sonorensis TaxID=179676 RepID=A0A336MD55_CULSO